MDQKLFLLASGCSAMLSRCCCRWSSSRKGFIFYCSQFRIHRIRSARGYLLLLRVFKEDCISQYEEQRQEVSSSLLFLWSLSHQRQGGGHWVEVTHVANWFHYLCLSIDITQWMCTLGEQRHPRDRHIPGFILFCIEAEYWYKSSERKLSSY